MTHTLHVYFSCHEHCEFVCTTQRIGDSWAYCFWYVQLYCLFVCRNFNHGHNFDRLLLGLSYFTCVYLVPRLFLGYQYFIYPMSVEFDLLLITFKLAWSWASIWGISASHLTFIVFDQWWTYSCKLSNFIACIQIFLLNLPTYS